MKNRTRKALHDYVIVIPTYKRADVFFKKTYTRIIQRYNLSHKVLLLIQCDEDEVAYQKCTPHLKQLRTPKGLLHTVNYVAKYYPKNKHIVIMHDDITRLLHINPPSAQRITVKNADQLFCTMFKLMIQHNCNLGGFYPTNYPLSMVRQPNITTDLRFIHDPITLIRNQKLMLNERFAYKMDFERTIQYYKQDKRVFRLNHYTFCTAYNPKTTTGGFGYRNPQDEKRASEAFQKEYAPYISRMITHKKGSTSFVLVKAPKLQT